MSSANNSATPPRIASVDAYRGFVMFLMMAEVLHLSEAARKFPDSKIWQFLSFHTSHVEWLGCSLHDMIQPSFSFLVGVALPFSLAARLAKGQTMNWAVFHAAWRALLLTFLGVFLRSVGSSRTNFTFEDTLSQIGLGYLPLFLLGLCRPRWYWVALIVILAGYWGAFALYPAPGTDFDYKSVGVPADYEFLRSDFTAHWNKNSNLAWKFDTWFLNLFPRAKPWLYNGGGYATLSFIPTLGTMILGLIAGTWLRDPSSPLRKVGIILAAGIVSLGLGMAAEGVGICPSVKKIWTPAWTLYSGGWCFLMLATFYALLDATRMPYLAFPLGVIGMNSIAAYCLAHAPFSSFIRDSFYTHIFNTDAWKKVLGMLNEFKEMNWDRLLAGVAMLLTYWLILFWMYRRRIFLRI